MSGTSNPPLHEISYTSNQPLPDSTHRIHPEQSIPPDNHPCGDLFDRGRRRDYINIRIPLFHASVTGDWDAVQEILAINHEFKDELLGYAITEEKSTALHIAVFSQKSFKLVENLVNRMTDGQLLLQDKYDRTAFYDAAAVGDLDMARVMVERCPQLLKIRGEGNWSPIHVAAIFGKRNMVAYLYGKYKLMEGNDWTSQDKHEVFYRCIEADLFVTWMRPIKESSSVAIRLLRKIWKNILERSSDEIINILKYFQVPFVAAEMGNTNFLVELIRGYPELLWRTNNNSENIFHIAASHRHESIYNLIFEMGSLANLTTRSKDKDGNNMLHLVGMKAKTPHEDVSGVVFQMQRELLWFKEVNSKVPTYCREEKNHVGRTPLQLFIENHKDMAYEGEKWMKETANQCMVVAALVTTIVFSVAFTIPGGYDQNNGLPVFIKDGPFMTFVILDAISLILSSASILMFLSILTSRYAQDDFLVALPKKLMIGLTTLFLSIITMMVTFSVSFFVLYHNKLILVPIIISVGALLPIFLYMKLQFPLLVDAYRSTYGSRYLFKPKKGVLFYRNPRF